MNSHFMELRNCFGFKGLFSVLKGFSFGHFVMTLEKYLSLILYPIRSYDLEVLLPDKGKLAVRRGRKATDPGFFSILENGGTAGLPTKG